MPDSEGGLGDPTEAPPALSSFPRPVPPPPVSAGRQGPSRTDDESDAIDLTRERMIFVELASIVLMASMVAYRPWNGLAWYALSVGLVSIVCCLSLRIADSVKPGSLNRIVARNRDPRLRRTVSALDLATSFLFFWWVAGAFVLTFLGPFTVTSNGYFAAWGGLAATVMWNGLTFQSLEEDGTQMARQLEGRHRALISLLACSVVVLVASIKHARVWMGAWGLCCGAVSIIVTSVLLAVEREKIIWTLRRLICAFLVLVWLAGAAILTFKGPFVETGNGYFGSWLGLLCALWYGSHDWGK